MIEQYLNPYEFTSKQEISAKTGLSEREVRRKISELKLTKAVLYNSQTKGHRLRKNKEQLSELNLEDLTKEMLLNNHAKRDIQSRIKALSEEIAPYEEYEKELQAEYMRKANDEFYGKKKTN